MISITSGKLKDKDMMYTVLMVYTEKEKSCVCGCGNKWTPVSVMDYKCSNSECKII